MASSHLSKKIPAQSAGWCSSCSRNRSRFSRCARARLLSVVIRETISRIRARGRRSAGTAANPLVFRSCLLLPRQRQSAFDRVDGHPSPDPGLRSCVSIHAAAPFTTLLLKTRRGSLRSAQPHRQQTSYALGLDLPRLSWVAVLLSMDESLVRLNLLSTV